MQARADAKEVNQHIGQIGDWVRRLQAEHPDQPWGVIGIRSRGDVIAQRVAKLAEIDRVGVLDITLYRDDLSEASAQPVVRTTEVDFSIDGLHIVLTDDVLMSGRSIRAAISSIMDMGRPKRIWLAVLVDRGGAVRELPIQADWVGVTIAEAGQVNVKLIPTDAQDAIVLENDQG